MIKTVDKNVIVDNVAIKSPATITVGKNKLWNSKSGRTKSGKWVGDLVAIKARLDLTWTNLTEAEALSLSKAFNPAYINVKYKDPNTNKMVTKKFYGGDESYVVYSYAIPTTVYQSMSVSIVEV